MAVHTIQKLAQSRFFRRRSKPASVLFAVAVVEVE
jgi:hypothetical protein